MRRISFPEQVRSLKGCLQEDEHVERVDVDLPAGHFSRRLARVKLGRAKLVDILGMGTTIGGHRRDSSV